MEQREVGESNGWASPISWVQQFQQFSTRFSLPESSNLAEMWGSVYSFEPARPGGAGSTFGSVEDEDTRRADSQHDRAKFIPDASTIQRL